MKTMTTLLALALTAAFTLTTAAQEIAGTWKVESVSDIEPPEGAELKLAFGSENKLTITYTLSGETQAWQYDYTVEDGQLKLKPTNAFGEPQTVTYDIKLVEGKLQLLTPKPEPIEEETDETEGEGGAEGEADSEAEEKAEEAEGDAGAEDAEAEDSEGEEVAEEEEEDTRVPVWVLVKA